jgi:2-polyprenyl-3-methyl-5-hydroxy-6-metoxy-1,4-benzoquinol methylase
MANPSHNKHFISRERCPSCDSPQFKSIYQTPYDEPPVRNYLEEFYSRQGGVEFEYLDGTTYELCECSSCGLIFQRDIPNNALMERLYEVWIDPRKVFEQHLKEDGLAHYSHHAQEIMQIVAWFDVAPSTLRFLDFGMGWGEWALMAKAFGCDAYGAELSRERIRHATSIGVKVVSWDEISRHRFDFINTEQVFEHIPEPLQTLHHLKKSLKPGGLIKISVPTANDIARRLRIMDWRAGKGTKNSLNPVAPLEHINFYRRKSLIRMASAAGLEEVLMPLKLYYRYLSAWRGINIAKNLLRPIYRNVLKRQNCLFFRYGSEA